jgi:hypothetical protein
MLSTRPAFRQHLDIACNPFLGAQSSDIRKLQTETPTISQIVWS